MVPVPHYLIVSALLFALGAGGIFFHRNLFSIFLCIELMLHAVGLTLVAGSRASGHLEGQALALVVVVVAAAEVLVGLAILIAVHRGRKSLDADDQTLLRH